MMGDWQLGGTGEQERNAASQRAVTSLMPRWTQWPHPTLGTLKCNYLCLYLPSLLNYLIKIPLKIKYSYTPEE